MKYVSKSEIIKLVFCKKVIETFADGIMIDSIRTLAKKMNVSFSLVSKVYQEMEYHGIIKCVGEQGYILMPDAPQKAKDYLYELFANSVRELKRIGDYIGYTNNQIIDKTNQLLMEVEYEKNRDD